MIETITIEMREFIEFIDEHKSNEEKKEAIEVALEFTMLNVFDLSLKDRFLIAISIIFKVYKFKHIKQS